MDKTETSLIESLKKFKKLISKEVNVQKFVLFGSRARGDSKHNSDVDILIISPDFEGKKSFRRSPLLYNLWDENIEVDFICLTPDELNEKQKQISMIRDAINEGIDI
ncbi:nucleotidyltransferase [Candidatus Pacearchaeota archaeon CG10_big_fil_rev_8_21_14_0_10_32_14]|nr:MAG: nucleotidyltransferase [Candidatus Pacearchaeota archaeon CG10_big_fil_rev_8_21_14_0_10_32_14]